MSEKPTPGPCAERVSDRDSRWPRMHQCNRRGVIEEDGKLWCKQHAPSTVAARDAERRKRWKAKNEADAAKWKRREDDAACGDACRAIGDAQLVAAQIGAMVAVAKEMAQEVCDCPHVHCCHDQVRAILSAMEVKP